MLYCNYSAILKTKYTNYSDLWNSIPKDNNSIIEGKIYRDTNDFKAMLQITHEELRWPIVVISVNIIYIGCYFLPYMVLAFIHDPLLTAFTYFMVALVIFCIYLIFLGAWHLVKFFKYKYSEYEDRFKCAKLLAHLLYSCMTWTAAFATIMFLFVITFIITLGSFDDFEELKHLSPAILLAVVGAILLQPICKVMAEKYLLKNSTKDGKKESKDFKDFSEEYEKDAYKMIKQGKKERGEGNGDIQLTVPDGTVHQNLTVDAEVHNKTEM